MFDHWAELSADLGYPTLSCTIARSLVLLLPDIHPAWPAETSLGDEVDDPGPYCAWFPHSIILAYLHLSAIVVVLYMDGSSL
jgi:hypothetical protein